MNWNVSPISKKKLFLFFIVISSIVLMAQTINMRVRNLNNTRYADQFSGGTGGTKLAACMADVPSGGGYCNAIGIEGSQTVSSDPFSGITRTVNLTLGAATYTFSATSTVPANVSIYANNGTVFSINSGITLFINGEFDGTISQHFTGSGTVQFASSSRTIQLYPQWWGAYSDGTNATTTTAAWQAAINAATSVQKLYCINGLYAINGALTITGTNFFHLDGAGSGCRLRNEASSSTPTIFLSDKLYADIRNIAIIGQSANPNTAIKVTNSGFLTFENLFLNPNGKGIHFTGAGPNSTIKILNISYWGSNFSNGATSSSAQVTNAILADSTGATNDVHIDHLNSVGYDTIANGGAAIKWDTSDVSDDITISNSELESGLGTTSATSRAIDLTNVLGFDIQGGNYLENTSLRIRKSRHGNISSWGGATFDVIVGDGTAPNACFYIKFYNIIGNSFTADANNENIELEKTVWTTYTNNSIKRVTIGNVGPSGQLVDAIGYSGIRERDRTVSMGEWVTPSFSGGNYSCSGGGCAWTVESGDVTNLQYMEIGKTMYVQGLLSSTTVTTSDTLTVLIPNSRSAATRSVGHLHYSIQSGVTQDVGFVDTVSASSTTLKLFRKDSSSWPSGTNNNSFSFFIFFEFQFVILLGIPRKQWKQNFIQNFHHKNK